VEGFFFANPKNSNPFFFPPVRDCFPRLILYNASFSLSLILAYLFPSYRIFQGTVGSFFFQNGVQSIKKRAEISLFSLGDLLALPE